MVPPVRTDRACVLSNSAESEVLSMVVDEEGVTKILGAVGLAPSLVNRRLFRAELGWCGRWYAVACASRLHKRKRKRLAMLSKAAKRCRQLLDDESIWDEISSRLPQAEECPRTTTKRLIAAVEAALKKGPNTAQKPLTFGNCSPFECVAGYRLPRLFEKHFHQPATVQRKNDGTPDSVYIRFAEAALGALGIKNGKEAYQRESIARALTGAQARRIRRINLSQGQS